uniref:ANK_REP_REGION domain-containing protein n=2 Tax=Romanomermis culicivorax TaxID=13658 RepID=A0A915ISW4_ROMCU
MSQQIVLDDQPCTSSSVLKSDRENFQRETMVKNQQDATSLARTHRHRSPSDGRATSREKLLVPRLLTDLDDLMERLELIHDHRIIQNLYSAGLSAFSFDDDEAATILLTPRAKMDNGQPVLMYLVLNLSDMVKQMGKKHWCNQHYVSILLSENIHVNDRDCEGKTVLMHACIKGYDKTAKSLINHPATDLMLQDRQGNTAFMYAAVHGRLAVLKCFLRILNKIDKTNRYRRQQMAKGCYCPPTAAAPLAPPCSSSTTMGGAGRIHYGPGDLAGYHSPEHATKLLLLDSALKFVLHYKNKEGQTALDVVWSGQCINLSKIHKRKDCQELLEDAEKKVRQASRRAAGGAFNGKFVNKFSTHTFRQKTSQPVDANGRSPRLQGGDNAAANFRRERSDEKCAGSSGAKFGVVGGQSKSLESLCETEPMHPLKENNRATTESRNRRSSSQLHHACLRDMVSCICLCRDLAQMLKLQ